MPQTRFTPDARRLAVCARGFTLIDLLVSVAVIAVLVALMLPAMSKVGEGANRVKCASNMRQIGMGLQMYTYDHNEELPESYFDASLAQRRPAQPREAVRLRVGFDTGPRMNWPDWDGLGRLEGSDYLSFREVFYCPSHGGDITFKRYAAFGHASEDEIVSNYHFRVNTSLDARTISTMQPSNSLVADSMRSPDEFNHHLGGLNVLNADLSSAWISDEKAGVLSQISKQPTWTDRDRIGSSRFDPWAKLDALSRE